jgi:hypothetical protein
MWRLITTAWPLIALLYAPVIAVIAFRLIRNRLSRLGSRKQIENIFVEPESEPSTIVTLVHGTFAPDAECTGSGSRLRRELNDLFGDNAAYYRHQWSGHNSFRSRREGAAALSITLKRFADTYPRARLFIIAHSHGGNVALRALTPEIMQSIDGVVCLATPVLTARKRKYDVMTSMMLNWLGVLPSLLVSLLFEAYAWGQRRLGILGPVRLVLAMHKNC